MNIITKTTPYYTRVSAYIDNLSVFEISVNTRHAQNLVKLLKQKKKLLIPKGASASLFDIGETIYDYIHPKWIYRGVSGKEFEITGDAITSLFVDFLQGRELGSYTATLKSPLFEGIHYISDDEVLMHINKALSFEDKEGNTVALDSLKSACGNEKIILKHGVDYRRIIEVAREEYDLRFREPMDVDEAIHRATIALISLHADMDEIQIDGAAYSHGVDGLAALLPEVLDQNIYELNDGYLAHFTKDDDGELSFALYVSSLVLAHRFGKASESRYILLEDLGGECFLDAAANECARSFDELVAAVGKRERKVSHHMTYGEIGYWLSKMYGRRFSVPTVAVIVDRAFRKLNDALQDRGLSAEMLSPAL